MANNNRAGIEVNWTINCHQQGLPHNSEKKMIITNTVYNMYENFTLVPNLCFKVY